MKRFLDYNKKLKERASEMRKNMTRAEKKLWFDFLSTFSKEKHKIYRQRIIGNFIVDFYLPDFKLVIELDGESHYADWAQEYDFERTQFLESEWCTIIRFTNTEVYDEFESICERIVKHCI